MHGSVFPALDYLQQQRLKYKTHSSFGQRYRQKVQYLFGIFSNNKIQKRIIFANEFSGERMPIFGLCLSGNPKQISYIDTLLEVDFRSLATHFEFRCPYRFLRDQVLLLEKGICVVSDCTMWTVLCLVQGSGVGLYVGLTG